MARRTARRPGRRVGQQRLDELPLTVGQICGVAALGRHNPALRPKTAASSISRHLLKNTEIAERVGVTRPVVTKWRNRFAEDRLEGLLDPALPLESRAFAAATSGGAGGAVRAPASVEDIAQVVSGPAQNEASGRVPARRSVPLAFEGGAA
ncbi:MAG: helix-turn-helix domain-containing protein [Thermoleophilaceae bacterium]|nr:helix-turn-helix domain-containing protein [Thermoleophilaceae bacterium]